MDTLSNDTQQSINILAFDTSGDEASLALWCNGKMKGVSLPVGKGIHSQAACLIPMMQDLMEEQNIHFQDLHVIATTKGPGSFTGIRIGLATAQGLFTSTQAKVFVPSTFDIAVFSAWSEKPEAYFVTITTKRESFYCQAFDVDLNPENTASIMTEEEVHDYLIQNPHLIRINHPSTMNAEQMIHLYLYKHNLNTKNVTEKLTNQLRPFYLHDPEFAKQKPWSP